jgi:hypothetical protein
MVRLPIQMLGGASIPCAAKPRSDQQRCHVVRGRTLIAQMRLELIQHLIEAVSFDDTVQFSEILIVEGPPFNLRLPEGVLNWLAVVERAQVAHCVLIGAQTGVQ